MPVQVPGTGIPAYCGGCPRCGSFPSASLRAGAAAEPRAGSGTERSRPIPPAEGMPATNAIDRNALERLRREARELVAEHAQPLARGDLVRLTIRARRRRADEVLARRALEVRRRREAKDRVAT